MRQLIKAILLTIVITCAGVSIYFIITIVGNRDIVVNAYNNLSNTNQQGADVIRTNFLQVYGTYGEELFIALGISKTDYAPGGVGDSDHGAPDGSENKICTCTDRCTSDSDFDDTCEVCKHDWKKCAYVPPCTCSGTGRCTSTTVDTSCEACTISPSYCTIPPKGGQSLGKYTQIASNGLYYVPQSATLWGNLKNGGNTWNVECCGTIAVYCAAANMGKIGSMPEDMGDMVQRLNSSTVFFDSNGYLCGHAEGVGENRTQWSAIVKDAGLNMGSPVSVENTLGYPTDPGDYVMYISHSTKHEYKGNSTTNAHWIYVKIDSSGNGLIANPASKENGMGYSDYAGNRLLIKYYKVS